MKSPELIQQRTDHLPRRKSGVNGKNQLVALEDLQTKVDNIEGWLEKTETRVTHNALKHNKIPTNVIANLEKYANLMIELENFGNRMDESQRLNLEDEIEAVYTSFDFDDREYRTYLDQTRALKEATAVLKEAHDQYTLV